MAGDTQVAGLAIHQAGSLSEALSLGAGGIVSLVGGGGKTTLMFALAHELAAAGKMVVSTTTTRILEPAAEESACVIVEMDEAKLISQLRQALAKYNHVTIACLRSGDGKLKGINPETLDRVARLGLADCIINEADGSARRPIKAPNATEPVVPASTSLVVALVGLDALGMPLSEEYAFRPQIISQLTGLPLGGIITQDVIATLLTSGDGIIKNSPAGARIIPFINKIDLARCQEEPVALAAAVLLRKHPRIERVILGELKAAQKRLSVIKMKL